MNLVLYNKIRDLKRQGLKTEQHFVESPQNEKFNYDSNEFSYVAEPDYSESTKDKYTYLSFLIDELDDSKSTPCESKYKPPPAKSC